MLRIWLFFSAGVIDQDYRGNVGVVMFNHSQEAFEVKKGDRIAQLICEKITYPELEEVTVSCFPWFPMIWINWISFCSRSTRLREVKVVSALQGRTETEIYVLNIMWLGKQSLKYKTCTCSHFLHHIRITMTWPINLYFFLLGKLSFCLLSSGNSIEMAFFFPFFCMNFKGEKQAES